MGKKNQATESPEERRREEATAAWVARHAQPEPAKAPEPPLVVTRWDLKRDRLAGVRGGANLTDTYMRAVQLYLDRLANPKKIGMGRYRNGRSWKRKSLDELVHGW
jgi:hypothetical protein